jgi:rare lipoprotein A
MSSLRVLLLVAGCVLVGCSSQPPETADGKPQRTITAAEVVDANPQAEPLRDAGNSSPYRVLGKEYTVLDSAAGYYQRGRASWYGSKFHGRLTANGEVFDTFAATAAHRSLPIPSFARVTNLENGRSMIVRVNDRGPFHSERIIDLSYGAAVKLGFAEQGTAAVDVEAIFVDGVVDLRGDPDASAYRYVQVASFSDPAAAARMEGVLRSQVGSPVATTPTRVGERTVHRVRVGPLDDFERLQQVHAELESLGYANARLMPE